MAARANFVLSSIDDNESGWGPSATHLPEQYKDIPYAPYSKGDKLGRIADWSAPDAKDNKDVGGRARQGYRNYKESYQGYGSNAANAFVYQHTEDESSFSVVDNRTAAQKKASSRGNTAAKRTGRNQGQNQNQKTGRPTNNRGGYNRSGYQKKPQRTRDASVTVGPEWKVLEEFELHRLAKLAYDVRQPEDIASYGRLYHYEKSYDRIVSKLEKPLQDLPRTRYNVTTSEDPVIQNLISKNEGTVYATDNILALLMSAPRSAYPWDIVIIREGDDLIFDKRDGGVFDYLSVNENAAEPPLEGTDINNPDALSTEATEINNNFSTQVLDEEQVYDFENPNPFYNAEEDTEPLASAGYRYRRFNLGNEEDPLYVVIRTEVDGVVKTGNTESFLTIKALNEFDPRAPGSGGALDWRQKLDTQRGAIVATEMKNNGSKLARWALQAVLAGCDQLKLGYVSRSHPKENNRHVILGTQVFKPAEFAAQMNLSLQNAWGILKAMVDIFLGLPEGKFVLVKDPNRAVLRLYSVPKDTFEGDDTKEDAAN
ncbi:translation initiation factor eIF-3, subunit D [Basidiobolus meristosporus CBS 931.73]|uniref:Eukaryotic translation initiation factor 3 subunit D n=1 Tax=Basidiobolus meristosporus CBS 931.73 TaxID=1314790 RepID=A0A1Y1YN77_9FUNG|nr:translation initiation factor eIF-3, subunit D [Basidiobolus meristosporus CBS 931.73]|eukprot:ORX99469.1 translation initiation factor eIF-3, subunit D [Basidiobolus meristosporus CBS 931.73]